MSSNLKSAVVQSGVRDFPYIRAWNRIMGNLSYWTDANLVRARADQASQDAVFYDGTTGKWITLEDMKLEDRPDSFMEMLNSYLPPVG